MPETLIPSNILDNMEFTSNGGNVLTPNMKDIFSDFPDFSDGLGGDALARELEEKKKIKPEGAVKPEETPAGEKKPAATDAGLENLLEDVHKEVTGAEKAGGQETPEEKKQRIKTGTVNYLKNKIEKEKFVTWNDFDDTKQSLDEYLESMSEKDRQELIDENYKIRQESFKKEYAENFYANMPGHMKYVAKAIHEGTMDPELAYVALGRVEQNRRLDPKDENDHSAIVESFLQATDFGTAKEIADQIGEWKEQGVLDKKAAQMKPKLDRLGEEQIQYYAQEAAQVEQQKAEAAEWYTATLESALKDGDLGSIKINSKQQAKIWNDLIRDVKPSPRTGQPMNALWRKMDEIQFIKPDFKHLSKIAWLALDPAGYEEALIQKGRNEAAGKITRELKTTQGSGAERGEEMQEQTQRMRGGIIKQRNPFETRTNQI